MSIVMNAFCLGKLVWGVNYMLAKFEFIIYSFWTWELYFGSSGKRYENTDARHENLENAQFF